MEKTDSQWNEIDETNLTIAERCVYRARKRAVELYRRGSSAGEILGATGLSGTAAAHLWKKCCARDPETGESRGYKALIPRSRIKKFIR